MLFNVLIAAIALAAPTQPLTCPVGGHGVGEGSPVVYQAGAKFTLCCPDCYTCCEGMEKPCCDNCGEACLTGNACCGTCAPKMAGDPQEHMARAAKEGRTVGEFLFDPIAGTKIDAEKAKATVDFQGMRYYFASAQNAEKFQAEPKKFAAVPEKEVMYCSVMKHGIDGYAKAGAYADFEGVRYFFCCPNCLAEFKKDPAKFVGNGAEHVAAVVTFWPKEQ